MQTIELWNCGWCRDVPSHRDFTMNRPSIRKLLDRLPESEHSRDGRLPHELDFREYCGPVTDQCGLPTSSAHACVAMVQYYERRASGRIITPSRLFVHQIAGRLSGLQHGQQVSLRTTLKGMVRFGFPPEHHWPYEEGRLSQSPDAFSFGFKRSLSGARYIRLDGENQTGAETLTQVKSFLASGYTCVFGCPLFKSLTNDPDIHFPTRSDDCQSGHAMHCVGYDDRRRIRSEKGALLVQNSWGQSWGERGFGWLPYSYVESRLAVDFWVLLRERWLKSEEFLRPC